MTLLTWSRDFRRTVMRTNHVKEDEGREMSAVDAEEALLWQANPLHQKRISRIGAQWIISRIADMNDEVRLALIGGFGGILERFVLVRGNCEGNRSQAPRARPLQCACAGDVPSFVTMQPPTASTR